MVQRQAGHDVVVVSDAESQPGYASYPEYLESLARAGVELHTVRSTFAREVAPNVDAAGALSRLIGNRHVDVIHAHAAIPAMIARLACGSRATPIIMTMHGWGIAKTADQSRTDVILLGLADAVVTPSAALRTRLRRLGVRQSVMPVVPYGIAPASARPIDSRDEARLGSIRERGGHIAMCIGTIGERKNQRLLVQALAQDGCAQIHAVFIGDGEGVALEAEAAERGVAARTHVLGYRSEASRYLRHADVVVLPSRDEGLPLVVLESLRDGVPVVASDIAEIAEALGGGRFGHLFSDGTVQGLAGALRQELSLPADIRSALATRQRLHWEQCYRLEQMAAAYEGIYAAESVGRSADGDTAERVPVRRRQ
jgi:glycosyltransferase involved in cell wall biosynthesis